MLDSACDVHRGIYIHEAARSAASFGPSSFPTRHLGANKGYASKNKYFAIKTHTLLVGLVNKGGFLPPHPPFLLAHTLTYK